MIKLPAAYADDPDTEWTSNYQKHVDTDKKLERRLKDRFEGNVEVRNVLGFFSRKS